MRRYGSQGQQRTVALSLKLAEIELVKSMVDDTPILLLDDVMSELDAGRRDALLDAIKETQTIITCTGYDDFIKSYDNPPKRGIRSRIKNNIDKTKLDFGINEYILNSDEKLGNSPIHR